jgi:hypothetical protein
MNLSTLLSARNLARHLFASSDCLPTAHRGDDPCPQCGARDAADGLDELIAAQQSRPGAHLRLVADEPDALGVLAELWEIIDQDALDPDLRGRVEAVLAS